MSDERAIARHIRLMSATGMGLVECLRRIDWWKDHLRQSSDSRYTLTPGPPSRSPVYLTVTPYDAALLLCCLDELDHAEADAATGAEARAVLSAVSEEDDLVSRLESVAMSWCLAGLADALDRAEHMTNTQITPGGVRSSRESSQVAAELLDAMREASTQQTIAGRMQMLRSALDREPDGAKALAAVRLAQRALKDSINMLEPDDWREGGRAEEYRAAESALALAFGEGE